jgi:uncharacterized membrane protein YesL
MAGIFGFFDYTKPGKGVDPDEPEKRALFRYLDILWHKLGKLVAINFIYFIICLPIIIAFHSFVFEPLLIRLLENVPFGEAGAGEGLTYSLFFTFFLFLFRLPPIILIVLLAVSIFLIGPATCGMTYVLRNFVRHEHAWVSDFWQRARMNFKQGVFLGVLDAVMFTMGFFNISVMFEPDVSIPSFMIGAAVAVFIFYLAMRNTLFLMAVTVEVSNMNLLRNSFILTLDGLWRHLLTAVINGVFLILIFLAWEPAELIFLPLIGFSLLGLTSVFISYPIIHKRLIIPAMERERGEDDESEESEDET